MIDHNESLDWAVLEVMDRSQPLPETLALVSEADLDEEKSMDGGPACPCDTVSTSGIYRAS